MPERPPIADGLVRALENLAEGVERFAARFLDGLLQLLRKAAEWVEDIVRRVVAYAARLLSALGRLTAASVKLLLVFTPAMIALGVALLIGSWLWAAVAVAYAAFVWLVGLSYGRRQDG
jgi:hypothetical protein